MTNTKIIETYNTLSQLKGLKGVKFNYAILRNIGKLEEEVKILQKMTDLSEPMKKFEQERIELANKYSKKDDKGESVVDNGQYVLDSTQEFNKEFDALKETYKDAIKERANQMVEFEELLKKENEVELYKIKLTEIPDDITTEQMAALVNLIEE